MGDADALTIALPAAVPPAGDPADGGTAALPGTVDGVPGTARLHAEHDHQQPDQGGKHPPPSPMFHVCGR